MVLVRELVITTRMGALLNYSWGKPNNRKRKVKRVLFLAFFHLSLVTGVRNVDEGRTKRNRYSVLLQDMK